MDRTLDRLAPLTGALFAVLTLVGVVGLGGDTPDSGDSAAKVVAFYTKHQGQQTAAALIAGLGALALIFFAGTIREAFRGPTAAAERRSSIAFGATLVTAAGLLLMAGSHFALADNTHKIGPQAAQSLNALDGGVWMMSFVGLAALLLVSGVIILSTRTVPVWMGWSAIVLGIVSVTPVGFVAVGLGIIWVGVLSVVLYMRGREATTPQPAVAPPAPAPAA